VYIADCYSCYVRKVTVSTGIITTIAGNGGYTYSGDGGQATSAALNSPYGIAVDASGRHFFSLFSSLSNGYLSPGNVYIGDRINNRVRKVTVSTGIITTIAGTGSYGYSGDNLAATSATLSYPDGVAIDTSGTPSPVQLGY